MMNKSSIIRWRVVAILAWGTAAQGAEVTADLGGRIQVDGALYDEDVAELGSGTEIRRARLFIEGEITEGWEYKSEFDFNDGDVDPADVYVKYTGLPLGSIKIGHFKAPFGLEELTSSRFVTFMERAMISEFAPGRRIGVGYDATTGGLSFGAALFAQAAGDSNEDEGLGAGARVAYAFRPHDGTLIHVGLSGVYEEPESTDSDVVRLRARPESHVTGTRLIDTGDIAGAQSRTSVGLELAAVYGSLSAQAEYTRQSVDTEAGSFDFDGYYAYVSWFPGGETRQYKNGKFDRTQAENAWEFGVRFSNLDLGDGVVAGGEEDNVTFGANYYVNPYLRFMLNYVMVDADRGPVSDEPNILQARLSLDFD
ncbi:MAG TPA: porin [Woeseiaceae bacterium]|nr:porin [Woeseiaceae bacterium]